MGSYFCLKLASELLVNFELFYNHVEVKVERVFQSLSNWHQKLRGQASLGVLFLHLVQPTLLLIKFLSHARLEVIPSIQESYYKVGQNRVHYNGKKLKKYRD